MNKRLLIISTLLITLTLSACLKVGEPSKISSLAVIDYINDEEYEEALNIIPGQPPKDDFRKVTYDFELEHGDDVITREIQFPVPDSWKNTLNSIDNQKRHLIEKGNEQNDKDENIVLYHREIIFYSKGLNTQQVEEALNTIYIDVFVESEVGLPTDRMYRVFEEEE